MLSILRSEYIITYYKNTVFRTGTGHFTVVTTVVPQALADYAPLDKGLFCDAMSKML